MKPALRVLHVFNELRPSGAETMLHVAEPHFRENGIDCELLSTGVVIDLYASVLEAEVYRIHHILFAHTQAFFIAVARFAKRSCFDLIHLHSERGLNAYVLAARLAGFGKKVWVWMSGKPLAVRLSIRLSGQSVACLPTAPSILR